jgi:hypothetical protein
VLQTRHRLFAFSLVLSAALAASTAQSDDTQISHCLEIATGAPAPPQASAVGYNTNTFSAVFDENTVDLKDSAEGRFKWYLRQFFGHPQTDASGLDLLPDGSLSMRGPASLNTAAPLPSGGWSGVAFGGGAYFEATLKFDPDEVIAANDRQWPAFWSMSLEHLAQLGSEHWEGQPAGFNHFAEADFFEYDVWSSSGRFAYGGATHDWFGVYRKTCPNTYCRVNNAPGGGTRFRNFVIELPIGTDFKKFHKYGYLWVPATHSTEGYAQYFFDDQPTSDKIAWSAMSDPQSPPPGTAPWTFGIMDQQHMVIILTAGRNQTMVVQSVRAWQLSPAGNLTSCN